MNSPKFIDFLQFCTILYKKETMKKLFFAIAVFISFASVSLSQTPQQVVEDLQKWSATYGTGTTTNVWNVTFEDRVFLTHTDEIHVAVSIGKMETFEIWECGQKIYSEKISEDHRIAMDVDPKRVEIKDDMIILGWASNPDKSTVIRF